MKKCSFHFASAVPINLTTYHLSIPIFAVLEAALKQAKRPLITRDVFLSKELILPKSLVERIDQIIRKFSERGILLQTNPASSVQYKIDQILKQLPASIDEATIDPIVNRSIFDALFSAGYTIQPRIPFRALLEQHIPRIAVRVRQGSGGTTPLNVVAHELSHPIVRGLLSMEPVKKVIKPLIPHAVDKDLEEILAILMGKQITTRSLEEFFMRNPILKGTKLEEYLRSLNELTNLTDNLSVAEYVKRINEKIAEKGLRQIDIPIPSTNITKQQFQEKLRAIESLITDPLAHLAALNTASPNVIYDLFKNIFLNVGKTKNTLDTLIRNAGLSGQSTAIKNFLNSLVPSIR